jgi:transposase
MSDVKIGDKEWQKIEGFLREHTGVYVGANCREFFEGLKWMSRSGAQWRLLPAKYGHWNSVFKRFNRWSERGIWTQMLEHFAADADVENLMMDGSVIRAHACAAGAKKGLKTRKG